jgi:hypothetical protein
MRTFVRSGLMLVAVVALCEARLAGAADLHWLSDSSTPASLVADEKAATPAAKPACASCCEPSCGECNVCCCDPRGGAIGIFGFDSFKGISDGYFPSNFGAVTGINAASLLPGDAGDRGLGWQLGMTYGIYDWDGRSTYRIADSQQQVFVTTGFFKKSDYDNDRPLSYGLVYDWMFNTAWGDTAIDGTMGQWRGQVEYALNESNGVGAYGCLRDRYMTQTVTNVGLVTARPVSQCNMFWHHKFESTAESWLWFGIPEKERLAGGGSLGDWIIGANVQAPISANLALYGNAQYMHPSAAAVATTASAAESSWNVGAGVVWYFGGGASTSELNGAKWLPYLPVANNSTFLVDQTPF